MLLEKNRSRSRNKIGEEWSILSGQTLMHLLEMREYGDSEPCTIQEVISPNGRELRIIYV